MLRSATYAALRSATNAALLALTLAGCAHAPPPARPAAPPPVAPAAPPAPARAAFLAHVPASARAVFHLGPGMLSWPLEYLRARPELRSELARYLVQRLGLDLTQVRGAVGYAIGLGEPPEAAVLVLLATPGNLALPSAGSHRGVALTALEGKLVVARVPAGLLLGTPGAVRAGIDRAQGAAPALAPDAPCFAASDPAKADLLVALELAALRDPGLLRMVEQFSLRAGAFALEGDRVLVRIAGRGDKLQAIRQIMAQALVAGLAQTEQEKKTALADGRAEKVVPALIAHHELQRVFAELEPRVSGDLLVSEYRLPRLEGKLGAAAAIGVLAAVAIPAFVKYTRRSNTVEAREGVEALVRGLRAHLEAHPARGKAFRFPASTNWAPAKGCCAQGGQCVPAPADFDAPTWRALGFQPGQRHRYEYRFTSSGKGAAARFVIEARGDLDCDGKHSSFRVEGGQGGKGGLEVKPLEVTDELE